MYTFLIRICFLISLLYFVPLVTAEDLALSFGDKYLNSGNYFDAVTEYKRYIFFNKEDNNINISYAYYKIGFAYRNQMQWNKSIEALSKSIQSSSIAHIRDERKIDLAVVYLAKGDYGVADFHLIKVELFSRIPELKRKASFFRGISSLYSCKWNQARIAFKTFFNTNTNNELSELADQIELLLLRAKNIKYKSPKFAKIISTVLPGGGQIYSGDWTNGLKAILINTATGYLFISDLIKRQYFDAIFNSLFLFERFYRGNRSLAEKSAIKYNRKLNQQFVRNILNLLNQYSDELDFED